jgi:hypothetical protein
MLFREDTLRVARTDNEGASWNLVCEREAGGKLSRYLRTCLSALKLLVYEPLSY